MAAHGRKNARETAILALACGDTIAGAARKAQISQRTLRRWRAEDPAFQDQVEAARAQMLEDAVGRLAAGLVASAVTLHHLVLKGDSHAVRLAAAKALFEQYMKAREMHNFEQRLQALEAERKPKQGPSALKLKKP
jgi:hypothetical protein